MFKKEGKQRGDMIASLDLHDLAEKKHPVTEAERIPVERINGYLILAGAKDDVMWNTCRGISRMKSHREALRLVFDLLVKDSIEDKENARIILGDDIADKLHPLIYDIDKAKASRLDPQVFFYCPNIVKTDYYGNVFYDADWYPNDENIGTAVPYWYALMEPVCGRRNKPEGFRKVNKVLFPNGTDTLDIYEWTTDWSHFFDDGHEWYGACCWSVYDKTLNRYVVMLVSATD